MAPSPSSPTTPDERDLVRQVEALRETVHELTVRATVAETVFSFLAGRVIRAFPADVQSDLLAELRKIVLVKASAPNPAIAAWLALEGEEQVAQLIDRIEAVVRSRAK